MKTGYVVLKNRLDQVARTFRCDNDSLTLVRRLDNGRVEGVKSTQELEDQGIEFIDLGTFKIESLARKAVTLENYGRLEFVSEITSLSPVVEATPEKKSNFKEILRWTAVGHLSIVAIIMLLGLFFKPEAKKEEIHIVQVFKPVQKAQKEKSITVAASKRKIKKHNKRVAKKVVKSTRKTVTAHTKRPQKSPKRTTRKYIAHTQKPEMNLNTVGALGVLGAENKKSARAGGFDASRLSNRRAGGAGGSVTGSGSRRAVFGKGLVASSQGSGSQPSLIGGYGTRGKAGGREGYGEISLVGSGAAFSSPVDSEAVIEGGLDRDQIAAVIRRHIGQIRFCYEKGLQVEPDLNGRVAVKFIIGGHGGVNVASVAHSSLQDNSVEGCIVNRLRSWQFPKPVGNVNVKVTYPFVLKRVSQG